VSDVSKVNIQIEINGVFHIYAGMDLSGWMMVLAFLVAIVWGLVAVERSKRKY
jgi:hypothetical protein